MSIVGSARAVGRFVGQALDEEDRRFFGKALGLVMGVAFFAVTIAASLALSAATAIVIFRAVVEWAS